jgi:site-specific DNA recombinase
VGSAPRAYIGVSANGNGGKYRYYACSGREKLGTKSCAGERLNRDKLEAAILNQLAELYRDGELIRAALTQAAHDVDRPAITEQRAVVSEEIKRTERAVDRYQQAFENGDLEPGQFKTRLAELGARLQELRDQEQELTAQLAEPADSLEPAALAAVADQLRDTIANGEPAQTKALLRTLIKEIRVNSKNEILPTYRVVTPEVRLTATSVERAGIEPATSGLQSRRSPS